MTDRNCKIQFHLHETRYLGIFRVADFELEVKIRKFKIADSKWRTKIEK